MTEPAVVSRTQDLDVEFTGKYEESGRVGNCLVNRFYVAVSQLLCPHVLPGDRLLEIGCGAGYSSLRIRQSLPSGVDFIGSDIGETLLRKSKARNPCVPFVRQSVYQLGFPDKSIDAVVMLEVLEHLDDPAAALAELHRVARKIIIISTPREPLWRVLNFMRGKYMRDLGNTPGHLQHWSSRGLRRQVRGFFDVIDMAQPIPWTVLSMSPKR